MTTCHVKDAVAESGGDNLGRHVAAVENTSTSDDPAPDVLGLELTNVTDPGQFHSYISFMDSTGTIGNIQGDGSGGVEFVGSLADFAEFFPKADADAYFEAGEVVGLQAGEVVSLDGTDPDAVLIVSTAPLVTGNRPPGERNEQAEYVKLSLVGQVPVQVTGPVDHGDVLVASPADDGTAVAAHSVKSDRPFVGLALGNETDSEVVALVGGPGTDAITETAEGSDRPALREELIKKDDRIADLEAENEQLRDRLTAIEDRLTTLEASGTAPAPADD